MEQIIRQSSSVSSLIRSKKRHGGMQSVALGNEQHPVKFGVFLAVELQFNNF